MIWLAIHLPHLPVESIVAASSSPETDMTAQAIAVSTAGLIIDADVLAREAGVQPGMSPAAARALQHGLVVYPRDLLAERQLREAVAACGLVFTPRVSIAGDQDIVLELAASLRLFGGFEAIARQLQGRIAALGVTAWYAQAPHARAALWLAGAGGVSDRIPVPDWQQALSALPLTSLRGDGTVADVRTLESLAQVGARSVADLDRLPRAGFARRFGTRLLERLDEAFGRRAMAMAFHEPPVRLVLRVDLDHAIDEAMRLLAVVERLFRQVEAFLRARAGGTDGIDIDLHHEAPPQTRVRIETGRAQCSADEFALLARERFGRLVLRSPVHLLEVRVDAVCAQAELPTSLFPDGAERAQDLERLVDRLQARLGAAAVQALAQADDHRPERASATRPWRERPAKGRGASSVKASPTGQRPLWLLASPQAIRESGARLYLDRASGFDHRQPLELLAGPERIEAGWWDGDEAARDYFLARSADAALLWIYRTRSLAARWFLHGVFA
jgi:protein ImuB